MRRIFVLLIVSVIIFSLCGCSFKQTFSSENNEYIVSAIGFDRKDKKVNICIEAIAVNSEDADADIKTIILEGEGDSVEEAFAVAENKASNPLQLSHMGIVAVGDSADKKLFSQIIKFCHSGRGITLSVRFISCKNSKELLLGKAVSSVAVGYDIMSMLKHRSEVKGINYKNLFYEIEALKEKPQNIIALPFFYKAEESFFIEGLKIYRDYSPEIQLSEEESSIYAIITDAQSKGEFLSDGKKIRINSSYSSWVASENNNLNLKLRLKLKLGKNAREEKEIIKKGIEKLYFAAKRSGNDIFGIENIIFIKKNKIWKEINKDYSEYFKNSTLSVEFI